MAILVLRPALPWLETLCSFFGVANLDASVAEALVFGCTGLFGLLFNVAGATVWGGRYGGGHLALGIGSALALGLAVAWAAGKLEGDAPPGLEM